MVPADNAAEASVVRELTVYGAPALPDVLAHLRGTDVLESIAVDVARCWTARYPGGPTCAT